MSAFEFLSVGLSFVLGLGVTTVLLSLVKLFRVRATVRWDWIPLAWAIMIFVAQIFCANDGHVCDSIPSSSGGAHGALSGFYAAGSTQHGSIDRVA
jgi:hypothetical protein